MFFCDKNGEFDCVSISCMFCPRMAKRGSLLVYGFGLFSENWI
jgi:hypothetical protein